MTGKNKPGAGRPRLIDPGARTQVTLRVDTETWNEFMILCRRNRTTATAWITKQITAAIARQK